MDARVHLGAGAPVVRLRWVYTDQPFLPIDSQCVILNRIWDQDQISELPVGQLPVEESDFDQDARHELPALAFTGHMCHAEWLAVGEPWPVPSTLPPTVYLDGWIPECCVMCCSFIGCSLDPVNAMPASQERQYPIAATAAVASTAYLQSEVGANYGGTDPATAGYAVEFRAVGSGGPTAHRVTAIATAAGYLQNTTALHTFADDAFTQHSHESGRYVIAVTEGAVEGDMTLQVAGDHLELCGTNLTICPALLPLYLQWDVGGTIAFGNAQFNAALITTRVSSAVSTLATRGLRLEPMTVTTGDIRVIFCPTAGPPRTGCLLYPATGESFTGLAVNAPYTLNMGVGLLLIGFAATPPQWCVIPFTV